MKKIIASLMLSLAIISCISIEENKEQKQIIDTTIIKEPEVKIIEKEKIVEKEVKPIKDLSNKTNIEILSDESSINTVFDRNNREYNYNLKGVWVATVNNLDYPTRPTLDVERLKREYIELVDNVKKWGMNAIFYQVKPGADAMYETNYYPQSRYLTGVEGENLNYDLLPFMIEEAHKRNIEFHAWINPYRASQSTDLSKISSTSIVKTHPEWTFNYGGKIFLNPGNPDVVDYVSRSIENIVKKYDVDGIHLDDYFYPYPVANQVIPDLKEYEQYGKNFSNIDDWRRNNVDEMVKNLSVSVHKIKPNIVFGISPFGIWKNYKTDVKGSYTNGLESYTQLYADSIKWMEKGWVDYIAPQIYWNIGKVNADYEELVKWWNNEAIRTNTALYVGHGVYKSIAGDSDHWLNPYETYNQMKMNENLKGVKGSIFFRYKTFIENPNLVEQINLEK